MKDSKIIIVGAGQAGARTALALREFGHAGPITLVGEEPDPPYERPPLSKGMLGADAAFTRIRLHEPEYYAQLKIELLLGHQVSALNRSQRKISLDDGSVLPYDRCILATGGRARSWPGELLGDGKRVVTLRTLQDARWLRSRLLAVRSLLIIGGGFLGLECADAARTLGISVVVVESGRRLLPDKMPPDLGRMLLARHASNGVQFRMGTGVRRIVDFPDAPLAAELEGGERLHAELCLVAIGQMPNIDLAADAGLETGNGIHVDAQCCTSDPSIFAAGDCASFPFGTDGARVRIESWHNAEQQSRTAAASALGMQAAYTPLPWFWTDQGHWNIQFLGLPGRGLALDWIVRHGSASDRSVWMGLQDGKIMAAVAVNSGGDVPPLRTLIARGAVVEPALLTDPSVKFAKLCKTCMQQQTI